MKNVDLAEYHCRVCVNYHSYGQDHGAWPAGENNGDEEMSVFEVTVMT